MYLLKYNKIHEENLLQFKNDLLMLLSEISNDSQLINKYIGDFYIYYNNVKNMLDLINESYKQSSKYLIKPELHYEFLFELDLNINNPTINLESINLIKTNFKYDTNLCSDKIKKEDYNIFCEKFDINYLFTVYDFPYFIVNIKKNNEYKQHYSFYEYKTLILKNTTNNELINFDFEKNIIYYDYVKHNQTASNDVTASNDETTDSVCYNKFFILENKIVVNDGPIYLVEKISNNIVSLDKVIYKIDNLSTLSAELFYGLLKF